MNDKIVLALPKGRILEEVLTIFKKINLTVEDSFFDPSNRKLSFKTNQQNVEIIKVRGSDIPTFVKYGGADFGICGSDTIEEENFQDINKILDLEIGKCRMSVAAKEINIDSFYKKKFLRIATKYPNITTNYFCQKSIQVEIIKLSGSIEIIPNLGLCDYIVDLVSSGNTLNENNMKEILTIMNVSSWLISNKTSMKVKSSHMNQFIKMFLND